MWLLAVLLLADSSRAFKVVLTPKESLQVEVSGEGTPVVLVPGLFGSAYGFRKLVHLLNANGYQSIVVEPLGIGFSSRPERSNYSLTAQADRIAAVLDSLGVSNALVVAHSIGGSMAFRLAYRHPERVGGLLSIEGGPTEQATTPAFRRAMRFAPWIKLFGGIKLIRKKIRHSLIAASGDTSWVNEAAVFGYTAGAARNLDATLKAFLGMATAKEPEKLQPNLARIRCPVRMVLGGTPHEGDVNDDEMALLRRSLAVFTVDSVAGAGHFIYEEQPEAVLAAVSRLRETTLHPAGSLDANRPSR